MKTKQLSTFLLLIFSMATYAQKTNSITANELVSRIKNEVTCDWSKNTVDTYKAGNGDMEVTGIVTSFISSLEILKKAVEMDCNMIITHEPTYYNGQDDTKDIENDPVYLAKKKFIEDNNLIVFRFHDHIHSTQPDGIYVGMINYLGWNDKRVEGESRIFKFEETTLEQFVMQLKEKFPESNMRIIGDKNMKFTNVGLILGAPYSTSQIKLLRGDDVEVIVAGETREWETVEYTRDASEAGMKKACILLGHAISEEMGMDYCATWLKEFITEVPIHFVEAGDPFWGMEDLQ